GRSGYDARAGIEGTRAPMDAGSPLAYCRRAGGLKACQASSRCIVDPYEGPSSAPAFHHTRRVVAARARAHAPAAGIADVGWPVTLRVKPPASVIDGFTPAQEFFLGWGQFRGDETRLETQRLMVQTDPHPVAKYRVIGTVSNLAAFQEAFSCKDGSPMV